MGKLAVYRLGYFLTIVFSVLLLGLSIYACFSGYISPESSMFTAYLSLGKPILVILNALMSIYWLCRWRYWVFVSLLGLLANYPFIASMWQPFGTSQHANGKPLKLISYNVHAFGGEITGYSAKEFANIANSDEVDLICFQEYIGNGDFTTEDLNLTFSKFLPYYYIPEGLSMAIFSKYPIIQSQVIAFPETNNGAIWTDINVKGNMVRVFNVHMQTTNINRMRSKDAQERAAANERGEHQRYLEYRDNIEANMIERSRQARLINGVVSTTEHPVILCGDFNDMPGTYTYQTLKGKLKDGFQTCGKGYGATFRQMHNLLRIDYIFHSPEFKGIKYGTMDFDMSDHNPVIMTLDLN